MNKRTTQKMDKAGQRRTDDIYENADAIRGEITMAIEDLNTTRIQPPQQTGSDCVKIRNYRAAVVCLVLPCVLLLTAVIVRCVTHTQEKQKLKYKNENLTNERHQLILKNTNLTNERDQLILKNTNLTNERNQLILKSTNLTSERDQLILKSTNLTNERDQLKQENNDLQMCPGKVDGWIYYQCSYYYMSNETKNWYDSRRYCTERGADLIIINNPEEQEFVKNISGYAVVWIGLTHLEGRWKWVDNSTLTSGFWWYGQPYSYYEDCAVSYTSGWYAYSCNSALKWICETYMDFPH